jgi:hypothetical protein
MASLKDDGKDVQKFSYAIPVDARLGAAMSTMLKMTYKAEKGRLFEEMTNNKALLSNPPPIANNATADQVLVWQTRTKAVESQLKEWNELADTIKNLMTDEVFTTLATMSGHGLTSVLDARDIYENFKALYGKVCEEDITKITAKKREPFKIGTSVRLFVMSQVELQEQLDLANHNMGYTAMSAESKIRELRMNMQGLNLFDTAARTISEIFSESLEARTAKPDDAFRILVAHMLRADADKRFGKFSSDGAQKTPATADVFAPRLNMVKEDIEKMDLAGLDLGALCKIIHQTMKAEGAAEKTSGGGAQQQRVRHKPIFNEATCAAARKKHESVPLNSNCPVHPGRGSQNPCTHLWKDCGWYTGKEYVPKGKKS